MEIAELYTVSSEWVIANVASVAAAIVILVVGMILSKLLATAVRTYLPGRRAGVDDTIAPLLSQVVRYGVLIVAIVAALSQLGVQTASLLAVIGAAGLAIALALQGTLSNIAAGVMLIWLRPMAAGEYIDGSGISGTVVEIGLFATRLRTADGIFRFVPNSQLWDSSITNYSREPKRRLDLKIGIAYDADIAKARTELMKLAADPRVLADPDPQVLIESLGDSAVVIMLRLWVPTSDYWPVLFEFNEKAKLAFDANGIEIPFNKLDLNVRQMPLIREQAV